MLPSRSHYFCGPSAAFDFVALFPNGNLPPDEDWALALAREAVIRPLAESTDQSEVTEEVVVTGSDEA